MNGTDCNHIVSANTIQTLKGWTALWTSMRDSTIRRTGAALCRPTGLLQTLFVLMNLFSHVTGKMETFFDCFLCEKFISLFCIIYIQERS